MKSNIFILVLSALFLIVNSLPANLQYYGNAMAVRPKRQPNHAMLFTGYYGQQNNGARQNGFYNEPRLNTEGECKNCGGEYGLLPTEEVIPNVEGTTQLNDYPNIPLQQQPEEPIPETVDTAPKLEETITQKEVILKKKQSPRPDSDEDDDSSWPVFKPHMRSQTPSLYNIFPIMFGGFDGPMGRSGGIPSGATAIANSFSTGKGGVATSHATAYGDPSSLLRNGNYARYQPQN